MAEHVHELRWWTSTSCSGRGRDGVRFAPRELPTLVAAIVADGPPAARS